MSTLTRTRRMPAKYCVRAGGITEIVYNATPEVIVVLPGTRWLEQRREREARLAAETTRAIAELASFSDPAASFSAPVIDTELSETAGTGEEIPEPGEIVDEETLSWTDRMRIASTKLIKRQLALQF